MAKKYVIVVEAKDEINFSEIHEAMSIIDKNYRLVSFEEYKKVSVFEPKTVMEDWGAKDDD